MTNLSYLMNHFDKDKNSEHRPKNLRSRVNALYVANNDYQQKSHVLFTFMPNKQCGQIITISTRLLTMLNTTIPEFYSFMYSLQTKLANLSKQKTM